MSKTEHSKLGGSSIARAIHCHGSVKLCEQAPKEEDSIHAKVGTATHKLTGDSIEYKNTSPKDFFGIEVEGVMVTTEMVENADLALDEARKIYKGFGCTSVEVEQKVSMGHISLDGVFGTADLVMKGPGMLLIADHKFGQIPVEPDSPQLLLYALMAAGADIEQYKEIYLVVIQPTRKPPTSIHKTTPAALLDWQKNVLIPTVEAVEAGDDSLSPREDICRFCRARPICPAFKERAMQAVEADFDGLFDPPVIDDALVRRVYDNLPLLKRFIEDVEKRAFELAKLSELPGHKLVHGRGRRFWKDEKKAVKTIKKAGHKAYTKKVLSPAAAEKLIPGLKKELAPMIGRIEGNPTIAPKSDRRKEIDPFISIPMED